MKRYSIDEHKTIIKGFTTSTYEVEAESYEDAIRQIEEENVKPIHYDTDIRYTEHMYYEKAHEFNNDKTE